MSEEIYSELRKFMDTMPSGFPETPTGVEIKILKKLFSPEQAKLTMKLKKDPEDISEIAKRINYDELELSQKLEELAQKGLIFRVKKDGKVFYQAYQFVVGVYEFQVNKLDKEFCELFEEYLPYYGISMASVETSQMRVIPVESAFTPKSTVATYNKIKDLVREQETISVTECICTQEQELLGNECFKPKETCIGFGDFAQYYLDNNMARKIDTSEALSLVDRAEEIGLVLMPTNTKELSAICCCCACCCPSLRYAKMSPNPSEFVHSYYQSNIDPELCVACGDCIDRCPMEAIQEGDGVSQLLDERCIGCGLCVSTCPEEAISLLEKPDMVEPATSFPETLNRIHSERMAAAANS
jgi:ferredoxin/predicted transcriptional regulator